MSGCQTGFNIDFVPYQIVSKIDRYSIGVSTRIQSKYPLAIFIHCGSHCLNLAVNKSVKIDEIASCLSTMHDVIQFFHASTIRKG